MSAENGKIDQYVDRNGFKGDTQFILDQLNLIEDRFTAVNSLKVKLNTDNSFKTATQTTNELRQATDSLTGSVKTLNDTAKLNTIDENTKILARFKLSLENNNAALKEYKKQLSDGELTQDKYIEKTSFLIKKNLEYKQSIADVNKELKNATAADFAIPNTIDSARAQNAVITKVRNATDSNDVERLAELNALLDRNNDLIDQNSSKLEKQKINIGNYPTVFKQAFGTLENELTQVSTQLASGKLGSKEIADLTIKQQALQNATALVSKEFATTTAQTNAFKEASKQIGTVYGTNSTVFKEFNGQVAEGVKQTKNIANAVEDGATKGNKFSGALSSIFGGLRKIAYAIPGIGLAGLIGLLITPLLTFGATMVKLIDKTKDFTDALEKTGDAITGSKESYQKVVVEVDNLKEHVRLAKDGFVDKQKVVDLYNDTMGKTTGSVKTLDEVEQSLIKNADAYIRFTLLKAAAQVAANKAAEEAFKAEEARQKTVLEFEGALSNTKSFGQGQSSAPGFVPGLNNINDGLVARQKAAQKIKDQTIKEAADGQAAFEKIMKKFNDDAAKLAKDFNFNFDEADNTGSGHTEKLVLNIEKEIKARQALLEERAKERIADLQVIADSKDSPEYARIKAIQDTFAIEEDLIRKRQALELQANNAERTATEQKLADALKNKKLTSDERSVLSQNALSDERALAIQRQLIIEKTNNEIYQATIKSDLAKLQVHADALGKEKDLEDTSRKEILDKLKIFYDTQDKLVKDHSAARQDELSIGGSIDILALDQAYQKGLLTYQQYSDKRKAIEEETKEFIIRAQIDEITAQIKLLQTRGLDTLDAEKKLYDAQVALNDVKNKKIEDADKKSHARRMEILDAEAGLATGTTGLINTIVDAQFENKKNALQKEIDLINQNRDAEIAAEEATTDSAQVKADKIALIQAKAQAKTDELARQQRQQDIQKAKFDKAKAITDIIINTAVSISKSLDKPYLIPLIAALGAVEVATVVAQPIPQYQFGTLDHVGGHAVVGDGGKSELAVFPDGRMYVTPNKDTIVDMPRHTMVYPDAEKAIEQILNSGMTSTSLAPMIQDNYTLEMTRALEKKLDKLTAAVINKPVQTINGTMGGVESIIRFANGHVKWVDENINF